MSLLLTHFTFVTAIDVACSASVARFFASSSQLDHILKGLYERYPSGEIVRTDFEHHLGCSVEVNRWREELKYL